MKRLFTICCCLLSALCIAAQQQPTQDFAAKFMAHYGHDDVKCATISPKMIEEIVQEADTLNRYTDILKSAKSMRMLSVKKGGQNDKCLQQAATLIKSHPERFELYAERHLLSIYVRRKRGVIVEVICLQRSKQSPIFLTSITGQFSSATVDKLLPDAEDKGANNKNNVR